MEKKTTKKSMQGIVISDKMDKTVVVAVQRIMKHPLYKKTMRKTNRYKAHDEKNECRTGDSVKITECRPLSKEKHFRVIQILERAK